MEQIEVSPDKRILDVTCGARTIWFNKNHPSAVYCDKRREKYQHLWKNAENCTLDINPDVLCDFTDLPFPDNSFPLVVFDPPHLVWAGKNANLYKRYGKLDRDWATELKAGIDECMRVCDDYGVVIFKWAESQLKLRTVLKAIGRTPLFGHRSNSSGKTIWMAFMKFPS